MDITFIFVLLLINGVFAMSEIAVVSARKARLQQLAEEGSAGAKSAVELSTQPAHFLSTIQVGITSVGILNGAIGEGLLTTPLEAWLSRFPLVAAHSDGIALALVVVGITYFSVVIGEIVPKRLALLAPERIATIVAPPLLLLAKIAQPLVWLLVASSEFILRLFNARESTEPSISNEEIKVLMEQGAEAGIFHSSEQKFVSNVLHLDDQRVGAIMTPRMNIYAIDLNDPQDQIRKAIAESPYARIVVYRGSMENILGVLQTSDLLRAALQGEPLNIEAVLRPVSYLPASVTTSQLLENFRRLWVQFALIVDEYGDLQGLVSVADVLTAIVGDLPADHAGEVSDIVRRDDGSWLVDGAVALDRFKAVFKLDNLPEEWDNEFHTLGGFVMSQLGRIPHVTDCFEFGGYRIEVIDMDRHRVDKLLVTRLDAGDAQMIAGDEEE